MFLDHAATLDAELVALDDANRPSFLGIGRRSSAPRPRLRLVVFDVLALDGVDLTARTWSERRAVLEALGLPPADPTAPDGVGAGERGWLATVTLPGTLDDALEASSAVDGEGVMAKRRDSRYLPGKRVGAWVKVKHEAQARVVVGGYRPGQGRREGGIGSLLLGIVEIDDDGAARGLRYVGKVGTGFTDAELDRLWGVIAPLRTGESPFTTPVPESERKVACWVRPEVVAEVAFDSWTPDGVLRAARWQGQVEA